jgi:hypothetical protein
MAQNTRVRLDPDIEAYLRSQSERVIGISAEKVTGADLTTLTNRILYEHKFAQTMMRQEFLPRFFSWIKSVLPGLPGNANQVVAIAPQSQKSALPRTDDLDFAADFVAQFNEEDTAA